MYNPGVIPVKYSKDIGDVIYHSIQESRTPLSDALLRIAIGLGISILVLWLLEAGIRFLLRKKINCEEERDTAQFIFTMIRYLVLLTAGYLATRAAISELTNTSVNSIQDMILWLHTDTVTLFDYSVKLLTALVIFILFHTAQNILFKAIKRRLDNRQVREGFSKLLLNLIKYTLLLFVMVSAMLQLMLTGGDNLIALALFAYICVTIAIPTRELQNGDAIKNKSMLLLTRLIGSVAGMILVVAISFGIFSGVEYLLRSGGQEISPMLGLTEAELASRLETTFQVNEDMSKAISENSVSKVTVRSDGELNLIYINGKQVGISTSGRKYKFFGVSINEPEITAVRSMNYQYTRAGDNVDNLSQGISRSHFFCNPNKNSCLVLTVNMHSNRVVNITYYSDYQLASQYITFSFN